jgi:hypothetical protein
MTTPRQTKGQPLTFSVTYAGAMPREVLTELKALVRRYSHTVPRWCAELRVEWATERDPEAEALEAGAVAVCRPRYDYRCATIAIFPVWLEHTPAERRQYFRHELRHIVGAPLLNAAHDVLDSFVPEETTDPERRALRDFLSRQLTRAWEMVTQDLTLEPDDDDTEETPAPAPPRRHHPRGRDAQKGGEPVDSQRRPPHDQTRLRRDARSDRDGGRARGPARHGRKGGTTSAKGGK